MSTLSDILLSIVSLVRPRRCAVCGGDLPRGVDFLCTMCRYKAPLTGYWREKDNPMTERFAGLVCVEHASALLFFSGGSGWRKVIHGFKYGGQWRAAYLLGRQYGRELRQSGLYDDIDIIVPVPLHYRKLLRRGYNQSTYIARGMAREMGVGVDTRSLRRTRNNPSQARKMHSERWDNVDDLFAVRCSAESLRGAHILLVDDVFTTGATVVSCIETLHRALPECRISVAALAVVRRGLGLER
ncbi:MAG: ComF family protein [Alistipes sp.]|nr:ComF family protein [Alistipes sp.]MDE7129517.1 ComF family protein [Alistipes sp.]